MKKPKKDIFDYLIRFIIGAFIGLIYGLYDISRHSYLHFDLSDPMFSENVIWRFLFFVIGGGVLVMFFADFLLSRSDR